MPETSNYSEKQKLSCIFIFSILSPSPVNRRRGKGSDVKEAIVEVRRMGEV
jgi:hypothetical protein